MKKKGKNHVYKNQKYEANESISKQPKEKITVNNQQKNKEKLYANETHGYKMMINDNKEDLRHESCCLPQIG
jgi:hypothetical protein